MIVRSPFKTLVSSILLTAALAVSAAAHAVDILLQSTTSTANSGLYEAILPAFTAQTGITVHVVSVGTGQAIKNAKNGDGDVLLVHAKSAEEDFVQAGYGVERFDVMYNDFIIVGPKSDVVGITGMDDAAAAFDLVIRLQDGNPCIHPDLNYLDDGKVDFTAACLGEGENLEVARRLNEILS